jgi:hypothetical protein
VSTHASPTTVDVTGGLLALAFAAAALSVLFLASLDQGTLTGGTPLFHDLFHDARHLLGFPCH